MKRIIEGSTYNTDTATIIAVGSQENQGVLTETTLYQSRSGVFFEVDEITSSYRDRDGDPQTRQNFEWSVIGDATKAIERCERYGYTIMRDIEDMPPEPKPGEKLSTIYLRVPPILKSKIDNVSAEDRVSANVWATRCLERCLDQRDGRNLDQLCAINWIASTIEYSEGDIKNWDKEELISALSEIREISIDLAKTLTGNKPNVEGIFGDFDIGPASRWSTLPMKYDIRDE